MNKKFYSTLVFILVLSLMAGILQGILYLMVDGEIFRLKAFAWWYLVVNLLTLTGSILGLKYYHFRGYSFSFSAGTVAIVSQFFFAIIFYAILEFRQLQQFYIPGLILLLITGLVYGISLITSRANEKVWLKRIGYFLVVLTLIMSALFLLGITSPNYIRTLPIDLEQWIALLSNGITLLFILHFRNESKLVKIEDDHILENKAIVNSFDYIKMISITSTLVFGVMITQQSITSLYWRKMNLQQEEELVKKSESKYFVNSKGDTLKYLLMKPKDFDPQKKYPLVVCLPAGNYGSPPAEFLSTESNRSRYPAFLFIPFAPKGFGWGGNAVFIPRDTIVYDAINDLDDTNIDRKRQYVSGVSLGGYGSWHFIITHPEMFAAAIPVCGGGNPAFASKIAEIPVWVFHGAKDKNVPVEESRNMIEAIKKAGGDPKYTEFPDKAHGIWWEVTQTPGVLQWLFEQKKP